MATAEVKEGEVSLNGVKYHIIGPVKSALTSVFADKMVTGDYTRDSLRNVSVQAWSDWRGGVGLHRDVGVGQTNRCYYSTCQLRYNRHLVLPWLVTDSAALTGATSIGRFGSHPISNVLIYCLCGDSKVYSYNVSTDAWSTSLHTATGSAFDARTGTVNNVIHLVFARNTDGFTYFDGSTWTSNAQAARQIAFWDNRLWGVNKTGQLWFTTDLSGTPAFTNDAVVPDCDGTYVYPNRLFPARLPSGETALYCATAKGLYVHDVDNQTFWATAINFPPQLAGAGGGSCEWRDGIFYASVDFILQYSPSDGAIRPIGPDRNDGLPVAYLGSYAYWSGVPMFSEMLVVNANKSAILAWNGEGWEIKAEFTGSTTDLFSQLDVFFLNSTYRAWWCKGSTLKLSYMQLPVSFASPINLTSLPYALAGEHQTAWFTADQVNVTKVALSAIAETQGVGATTPTTAETVTISYGLDYDETTWTALGSAITCAAYTRTEIKFPNSTTPTGTAFKAIRFRVQLARGTSGSNPTLKSPDLVSLTLNYIKIPPQKWGFEFQTDFSKNYGGNTPDQLNAALRTAIASATLVEFTYRDPAKTASQTYYVQVKTPSLAEMTGHNMEGQATVMVTEL